MLLTFAMLAGALPEVEPPASPARRLTWGQYVSCVQLAPTKEVPSGAFRVQCDEATRTCLASPGHVLVDGVESDEALARTGPCGAPDAPVNRALFEDHYRVEEAIAEAPPGWYRDERGRVVQVNFDLGRRVFFGGAWAPLYRADGASEVGRARVELGVAVSWFSDDERQQHRMDFLEGTAWLGAPGDLRFDVVGFRYGWSARRATAPVWVTTFIGQPRRFDVDLNLTAVVELLHFESLGGKNFLNVAQADLAMDLWHSRELDSWLRVRVGPGLEVDLDAKTAYFLPTAAVEAQLVLDREGFHHVTAGVLAEKLIFAPVIDGRPLSPQRLKVRAGYELILLAINDYPLTLVLEARAGWRDDVPTLRGWEFQGQAGLRFSLWAPARFSAEAR
jgi:hypothetical protein